MKKLLTILMAFALVIGIVPVQYVQAKSIKIEPSNSAKTAPKLENIGTYKLETPSKKSNTFFQFVAPETGNYEFIFYDMRIGGWEFDGPKAIRKAPSKIYFSRTGKNKFNPISLGKTADGKDINFLRFAALEYRALLDDDFAYGIDTFGADPVAYSDEQLKEAATSYTVKETDGKLRCSQIFHCNKGKKIYVKVNCTYGSDYKVKIKKSV